MNRNQILRFYYLRVVEVWDTWTTEQKIKYFKQPMRFEFMPILTANVRFYILARLKEMRAGRKLSYGQLQDFADWFGCEPLEMLERKARIAQYLLNYNPN